VKAPLDFYRRRKMKKKHLSKSLIWPVRTKRKRASKLISVQKTSLKEKSPLPTKTSPMLKSLKRT
jgi:hypothetical protein